MGPTRTKADEPRHKTKQQEEMNHEKQTIKWAAAAAALSLIMIGVAHRVPSPNQQHRRSPPVS
jgi:hypothetical protein